VSDKVNTSAGWTQSVQGAKVVSAEELRRQAALFRPNLRQEAFRDVAEQEVDNGNLLLAQWLLASKDEQFRAQHVKAVSRAEFDRWLNEPGFSDWFFEPMPQVAPLASQELHLADQLFLGGLMQGMQGGEDWAFKEYGRFRFGQTSTPAQVKTQQTSAEVDTFLAPEAEDAWVKKSNIEA
jgi:hypothetical protein